MSRTHKDAPQRIRKARLGVKDSAENCKICEEFEGRTVSFGFTAIFFAHELKEIESFLAVAEEEGYSIERSEVRGYLGNGKLAEALSLGFSPYGKVSAFAGYFDPERAIYSKPRGLPGNLLWSNSGRFGSRSELNGQLARIYRLNHAERFFFEMDLARVSAKENIFTVVSISKELKRRRHYHGNGNGAMGYLFDTPGCGCCDPYEKDEHTRIRSVATELKKIFNGGDHEAIEEIAGELVRSRGLGAPH